MIPNVSLTPEIIDVPHVGRRETFTDTWLTGEERSSAWEHAVLRSKTSEDARREAIELVLDEALERVFVGYTYLYRLPTPHPREIEDTLTNLESWIEKRKSQYITLFGAAPKHHGDADFDAPLGSPLRAPEPKQMLLGV